MLKRLVLAAAPLAACLALLAPAASSQSVPNGQITQGEVWNTDQWNQAWESKQDLLGYTPVQQGGGTGQGANKLYLGWDATAGQLRLQVDTTSYGANWPINAQSAGALAPGAHISVSGDVTTAAGVSFTGASDITLSVSLPIVNASPGGCGDASHVPVLTLDSKGRATGCTATSLGAASTAGSLSPGATIAVSGDASTASGVTFTGASGITLPVTLATVNSNTGACGDASHVPVVTLDAKGRATACTATALGAASTAGALSPGATIAVSGDASTASGVTFTGASGITLPVTLATVNSNTGACGDASHVPVVTLDGKGRATACSPTAVSSTCQTSTAITPSNGGTGTFAHTLGATPSRITIRYVNVTADQGYSPGDVVLSNANGNGAMQVWAPAGSTSSLNYVFGSTAAVTLLNATTGASATGVNADWSVYIVACL